MAYRNGIPATAQDIHGMFFLKKIETHDQDNGRLTSAAVDVFFSAYVATRANKSRSLSQSVCPLVADPTQSAAREG